MISGLSGIPFSSSDRQSRYCAWSSHYIFFSDPRRVSVRDPNQGMQIPTTVTSPTEVRVTPYTNRPGGMDLCPRSSARSQDSRDHSMTFLWFSFGPYPESGCE